MPSKKTTQGKAAPGKNVKSSTVNARSASSLPLTKRISRRNTILTLAIIIIAVLLYVGRGLFIAAVVNGQIIPRWTLTSEMDKQYGKKTLEGLITKNLIFQEMRKRNIVVNDAEIQSEIAKIETALKQQGRTLPDALAQQGLTKADLMDQIRIQKLVEKLFANNIKVTDQEVDKYMTDNKDSLPAGQDPNKLKETVRNQLKQQKLAAKFQSFIADLQKKASIQYFVNF